MGWRKKRQGEEEVEGEKMIIDSKSKIHGKTSCANTKPAVLTTCVGEN